MYRRIVCHLFNIKSREYCEMVDLKTPLSKEKQSLQIEIAQTIDKMEYFNHLGWNIPFFILLIRRIQRVFNEFKELSKVEKLSCIGDFAIHNAIFFRFMHAKTSRISSCTRFLPLRLVYRIPCFSFASAKTLSIVRLLSR